MFKRLVVVCALAAAVVLTPSSSRAQDAPVSGPVLGFVFDSNTGTFRAILGIPGAATQSEALPLGFSVSKAEIAPRQDFALAVVGEDATAAVVKLSGSYGTMIPIAGASPDPARMIL